MDPASRVVANGVLLDGSVQSVVKGVQTPLEGLEPPTVSLGRNCSSIELQRLAASSLSMRQADARQVADGSIAITTLPSARPSPT